MHVINTLKPRSVHTVYLCVLCGSQNKQPLFPYTALTDWFLGAFGKWRKATITFFLSVCLSVCPNVIIRLPLDGLWWNQVLTFSEMSVQKIQVSLKSDNNNRYCTWRPIGIFDHISLISSWNEKCCRQNCREDQNTHFISNNVFPKLYRLWDNVEKYCTPGQVTDDNIVRRMRIVCWIPKAEHKLSICDTYFSNATTVHERS